MKLSAKRVIIGDLFIRLVKVNVNNKKLSIDFSNVILGNAQLFALIAWQSTSL
jgi:hypothetical protein